ncbi:hypothetical protein GCM10017786_20360 [Amycolatopsis deserti]|uniref:Chorismate-utilising enzyme C-terminal domain-containing protein n=1 Tax=Amycolatopsis deserti TaxID=185696 RepID=A0ABQ3IMQ5_9PSEU|nr:hypothetical protein GCM10017786_20360 [Amycolatopsis deserti]
MEGHLGADVDDARLLRAVFPSGSVTGAPKIRALELIAEVEREPRGVYCGAVGLVSPIAGTELNVAIRTLELHPGGGGDYLVDLGVGGGITADSDPDAEWAECLHKAAPLETLMLGRHRLPATRRRDEATRRPAAPRRANQAAGGDHRRVSPARVAPGRPARAAVAGRGRRGGVPAARRGW